MVNVFAVYDKKYGNTRTVAESIVEGLGETEDVDITIVDTEDIDINNIPEFDVLLIGSPNHIGGPVRGITRFIDRLGKLGLTGKKAAVFDTYMGGDVNKVVQKMEKRIKNRAPGLSLITSGLSVRVDTAKGPIAEDDMPKCRAYGETIAKLITS